MKKISKKIINFIKSQNKYLHIYITVLILLMPLISTKITEGHDFMYHITNIDAMTKQFLSGDFSKITMLIGKNFGYGGSIFYPKLPHIFTTIISCLISFIDKGAIYALKISYIIVLGASGIMMHKLLLQMFKNQNIAKMGSLFYITMPYLMSTIYVRAALNEFFIYLFMPMILLGLISLKDKLYKKFYLYFSVGYIGLINSHLVLAVYFTIIISIFLIINYKVYLTKDNIKNLIKSSIIILIISLPSIVLLLEHKFLNIYTVFDSAAMNATSINVKSNGLSIIDFAQPEIRFGNNIYVFINAIVIIFCLLSLIYLIKYEKNKITKKLVYSVLIMLLISMMFSYNRTPYEYVPELLLSVQFGFRFMAFVGFFISIFAAYGLNLINKKYIDNVLIYVPILCCIIVIPFINYSDFIRIKNIDYNYELGMGSQKEYLNKNIVENMDYFNNRNNEIKVLNDKNINITNIVENNSSIKFNVKGTSGNEITLEIPRIYYLGYNISQTINGKEKRIDYKNGKNGFITLNIHNDGLINVQYKGTTLYIMFIWLRRIFVITMICIYTKKNNLERKLKHKLS